MVATLKLECSFPTWYSKFAKDSIESTILELPEDIINYLEHYAFILPLEAINGISDTSEWSDGTSTYPDSTEDSESQYSFPEFSKTIQSVIDDYGAVCIKSNWSMPLDATWIAPTKTLKCTSLEDVYLLLKGSDRISEDLSTVKHLKSNKIPIHPCLVLKRWREINPASEFRCFVVNKTLIGICQRDASQYYSYIENEKYDIQKDIKTLFTEKIQDKFEMDNYSFDVTRCKKDKVKILDFGPLDESITKCTLFTYEELVGDIIDVPEFRYIAEEMGIQPKKIQHICVPQEINEYFQSSTVSVMDAIRKEVAEQNFEDTGIDSDD